jgi:hypothetical protein
MRKFVLAFSLALLTGCGGQHYQYSVYGRSGAKYQAPALCEALTKCLNSKEQDCFYETLRTSDGSIIGCTTVPK